MVVIKSHSVNFKKGKYKLENIEIKLSPSFSSKKNKKEKNKIKIKPLFKSEEIVKKIYLNKNKRMSLNNKESLHNSINTKFKSLKEREIIMKNSDLFLRDSKVRMKNQEIKNGIKIKIEEYKKIFNLLDRNKTGILSIKNLNLSLLTNDQLELLLHSWQNYKKEKRNEF